jgi:hypothetical protein
LALGFFVPARVFLCPDALGLADDFADGGMVDETRRTVLDGSETTSTTTV